MTGNLLKTGKDGEWADNHPSIRIIPYSELLTGESVAIIQYVLKNDGVIVYPTDTLYGLGGNFLSRAVHEKIDRLKQRSDAPYSVAVGGIDMLERLTEHVPSAISRFIPLLLPGKFTFLMKPSPAVEPVLTKHSGKIGVRIPDAPPLLTLLRKLDIPLATTSVNRTGRPALNDPSLILREFAGDRDARIDLLIDAGPMPESSGSTILDLTVEPFRLVRRGDESRKLDLLGIPYIE